MELFTLDSTNHFKPSINGTITKYDTLVWTERYREAGEFVIEVEDDISLLTSLPSGTLISHTNTDEVMIVDDAELSRTPEKKIKVTVKGRSFEIFAQERPTANSYLDLSVDLTPVGPIKPATLAQQLLEAELEDGVASANNKVLYLEIELDMRDDGDDITMIVKRGDTYSAVMDLLSINDVGIKTIRPKGIETTLIWLIHDGVDRTDSVTFHAQYEDLVDTSYFISGKGYKNYATVATAISSRIVRSMNVGSDQTGLNRRIMYVDASDLPDDYDLGSSGDELDVRGQVSMLENKNIFLVHAEVASTARPKFKIHYDIGDIVSVFTEFGPTSVFRVTEHILTKDSTGINGYPALSVL